jgi:hypothetical protein
VSNEIFRNQGSLVLLLRRALRRVQLAMLLRLTLMARRQPRR